jgi:hypothetical protein
MYQSYAKVGAALESVKEHAEHSAVQHWCAGHATARALARSGPQLYHVSVRANDAIVKRCSEQQWAWQPGLSTGAEKSMPPRLAACSRAKCRQGQVTLQHYWEVPLGCRQCSCASWGWRTSSNPWPSSETIFAVQGDAPGVAANAADQFLARRICKHARRSSASDRPARQHRRNTASSHTAAKHAPQRSRDESTCSCLFRSSIPIAARRMRYCTVALSCKYRFQRCCTGQRQVIGRGHRRSVAEQRGMRHAVCTSEPAQRFNLEACAATSVFAW